MGLQRGSAEHAIARAEYFSGLVTKTNDPVYWDEEKIRAALLALQAAIKLGERRYREPFAMAEIALAKAGFQH